MARVIPPRRMASLLLVVLCLAAPVLNPMAAGADPISDKRSEAEEVADRLEELRMEVEVLAEQFNEARLAVAELKDKVTAASTRVEKAKAEVAAAKKEIASFAVNTYIHGDIAKLGDLAMLTDQRPDAGQREKYASAAIGNREELVEQFRDAKEKAEGEVGELKQARKKAEAAEARVGAKKKATEQAVAEQTALSQRLDGELATLVKAEQERRQARRQAQAAQERPAAPTRQESQPSAPAAPEAPAPPPPPEAPAGGGAATAIAAGKTQLGVPYLWAGSSPSTGFDCSGFVMWAWAQGGKSLPHSSRAMYAMSTKISMSELQPGDLVFYGQPSIHHVALYMGGGQIIHSPGSGDVVRIDDVNYWDELAGAGRV